MTLGSHSTALHIWPVNVCAKCKAWHAKLGIMNKHSLVRCRLYDQCGYAIIPCNFLRPKHDSLAITELKSYVEQQYIESLCMFHATPKSHLSIKLTFVNHQYLKHRMCNIIMAKVITFFNDLGPQCPPWYVSGMLGAQSKYKSFCARVERWVMLRFWM